MTTAIPTRYGGTQFRSRLEARWAAFFDLLGWSWEYEPVDLDGYIPDFMVQLNSALLVEVKPLLDESGFVDPMAKILRSNWVGDAAIVGAVRVHRYTGKLVCGIGLPTLPDGAVWTRPYGSEGLLPIGCPEYPHDDVSCRGSSGETFCGSYFGARTIDGRTAVSCASGDATAVRRWRWFGIDQWFSVIENAPEHESVTALWREAGNRVQWRAPEAA